LGVPWIRFLPPNPLTVRIMFLYIYYIVRWAEIEQYLFKLIELDMNDPDVSAIIDEIKVERS